MIPAVLGIISSFAFCIFVMNSQHTKIIKLETENKQLRADPSFKCKEVKPEISDTEMTIRVINGILNNNEELPQ